jgi:hypothetical protein
MPKIDLSAKAKTEVESQKVWDQLWINITPLWFDWLQWVLVLGVIGYIANESQNVFLRIIYAFSYMAFYFYIQGIFYSLEFQRLPFVKTKRAKRMMSVALSGIMAVAIWVLISSVISELQGKV